MNKTRFSLLTAALVLATTFTLSCSDSGGGNGNNGSNPIKKDKISGVSQKGPFVEGSTATLYELDGDFNQTGRSFRDIIADNKGSFEIRGVELISPYAMLEASGYYRNEVTGNVSTAPITLFAIADIREKDNVNVNILTHLEYYRVLNLVENSGKSVAEAKKQAQKEILAVFGISGEFENSEDMSIFGTSEGDAALLAISVLLQGDLSEGEFSQRLTNFAQGIKENGTWDNEAVKTKMADWAAIANLESIKNSILGWGLSSEVPDFGKYTYDYWVADYGLEVCNELNNRSFKNVNNIDYICKNNIWQAPTKIDLDTRELNCSNSNEGEFKILGWGTAYICKNSVWNIPTLLEKYFSGKKSCLIGPDGCGYAAMPDEYTNYTIDAISCPDEVEPVLLPSLPIEYEDYTFICYDGFWRIAE